MYNNYLWNFCVKYTNFDSEIHRNYEMWIFRVSFEESFWKFQESFMEISYTIQDQLKKCKADLLAILDKFSYSLCNSQPIKVLRV